MKGGCLVHRAPGNAKKAKPAKAALDEQEDRSKSVTRGLLIALLARVAFFLLPFLPLRVKNFVLISKVGFSLLVVVLTVRRQEFICHLFMLLCRHCPVPTVFMYAEQIAW